MSALPLIPTRKRTSADVSEVPKAVMRTAGRYVGHYGSRALGKPRRFLFHNEAYCYGRFKCCKREKRFWQVTNEGLPRLSRGEDTP